MKRTSAPTTSSRTAKPIKKSATGPSTGSLIVRVEHGHFAKIHSHAKPDFYLEIGASGPYPVKGSAKFPVIGSAGDVILGDIRELRIIDRVKSWYPDRHQALSWYQNSPIPGFGEKTASDLVAEGHEDWVMEYLDGVEAGIHV